MVTNHLNDKLTLEFKKNLKEILEQRKGVTNAKKLSVEAGLGETAVRDILQGRSGSPKLDTVNKIAAALSIPIFRLMPSMIDESYHQLSQKDEEITLLREISGLEYDDMSELRRKALEKSKKK